MRAITLHATAIADMVRENERLWKALIKIADYANPNGCCDYGCDCPTIAREALGETK